MEPVFVVLIVFGSALAFTKMALDYRRSKLMSGGTGQGSLGTSELKRMIQEAVEETMRPVVHQLERLDARLEAKETKLLDEPLDRAQSEEAIN